MTQPSSVPCAHCGLPAPPPPADAPEDAPSFCCVGCHSVYLALHESGLDSFYQLRNTWSSDPQPAQAPEVAAELAPLLDSEAFLNEHAKTHDDGSLSARLHLEGVHCAGCVWLIERLPELMEGVLNARLDLTRGLLSLRWDPAKVRLSEIGQALARFGYRAHPLRADQRQVRNEGLGRLLTRVGISWAVAMNTMIFAIAEYAGLSALADAGLHTTMRWLSLGLSMVALVVGGSIFFRRAWASLRTAFSQKLSAGLTHLSIDVPIALGIGVGWVHSMYNTVWGQGDVWFDSLTVLIAALLSARYLQLRGNARAADAAERLYSLLPRSARLLRRADEPTSQLRERAEAILATSLRPGDLIEVRTGDVVAADGIVMLGRSEVLRALLTGESRPEKIAPGQVIEAGVTNLGALLHVEVRATAEETRVGKLLRWIEDHKSQRAPIVQLADRLGGIFVLAVLGAALVTSIIWALIEPSRAIPNAVALLVISCPCALGMATPLAMSVGAGRAARRGVHIKNDDVIEALDHLTDLIFDKTGTLTVGQPTIAAMEGDEEALSLASALESHSSHPLARALVAAVPPQAGFAPLPTSEVEEHTGRGITGRVGTQRVAVGRPDWQLPEEHPWCVRADELAARGLTPLVVMVDEEPRLLLGLGDRLRPGAGELVSRLGQRGVRVHLVSGDHPELVARVGEDLGIEPSHIRGGASPEDKVAFIKTLRDVHPDATVAMIGDGVNDAAALQAAHVGVAVYGGSEASLQAADIFLMRQGLTPVEDLLDGSKTIMRTVRRNLLGSAIYNVFGVSLAALGLVSPLVAALLMPISSLAVVASSLSQRSFEPRPPKSETTASGGASHASPSPRAPSSHARESAA
ncbi:heavy metal translocating P-type ATPase [Lujinxingia sediminis]|uniref:Heavy metal translocating P-type ATPase n=1 Tax=Lujinxingia sediminis TaxID=2480984 RepID=A0ABY0CQJ3_9DELT|nr:heavy metal translocating P-type ATPase [Lujinxingia sediminis]RVU42757.1 heavy metal translocating P-type ATPase [Lujinxingia sediminis]